MSVVTNLLVSFSILEDDDARLEDLNRWLDGEQHPPLVNFWRMRECYGGSKHMEAPLLAGAFNHFEMIPFIAFLRTVRWEWPDEVQVLVRAPDESTWHVIDA